MTVKELIEKLQSLDQDKIIKCGENSQQINFVGTYWDWLDDDKEEPVDDIYNPYIVR